LRATPAPEKALAVEDLSVFRRSALQGSERPIPLLFRLVNWTRRRSAGGFVAREAAAKRAGGSRRFKSMPSWCCCLGTTERGCLRQHSATGRRRNIATSGGRLWRQAGVMISCRREDHAGGPDYSGHPPPPSSAFAKQYPSGGWPVGRVSRIGGEFVWQLTGARV